MSIREQYELTEKSLLAQQACVACDSKGRLVTEVPCKIRTCFQRDRDRIIHSKAFRRLKHKTQVFIAPIGDHYRTRLTHTLEVAQIARTIGRALRLNEDLIEAIALGHDLGHTPFGHAGEDVLNNLMPSGFKHNHQSLRIIDVLEGGKGINCTYEVRDGILNHTGQQAPCTLEGRIVRLADRIAYINHDIDDAIRGRIITPEMLPVDELKILGATHSARINTMVMDVIVSSSDLDDIKLSEDISVAMNNLRDYMFKKVYIGSKAKLEEQKVKEILKRVYEYFIEDVKRLPLEEQQRLISTDEHTVVGDYISGMTDRFIIALFQDIFLPKSWPMREI